MIDLFFDMTTGVARVAAPATIKTGSKVPVSVTFSAAPATVTGLTVKLVTDATPPVSKASFNAFNQESDTVWTGTLDLTAAAALDTYMADKASAGMNVELSGTIDGLARIAPNAAVTVQAKAT